MNRKMCWRWLRWMSMLCTGIGAFGQTAQVGADPNARGANKVRVDYVGYRAARWDAEHIDEPQNEWPNRGGLVYVYLKNTSEAPVRLAFWRVNDKDESYWRLGGGQLAWDRVYDKELDPGENTVLEIDATSEAFADGQPFKFAYVSRDSWGPVCRYEGTLKEDAVRIACIRVMPGMKEVEVHVRHTGKGRVTLDALELAGRAAVSSAWVGEDIDGPGNAIGRIALEAALEPSALIVAKVGVKEGGDARFVCAHRRAFEDWFPIGVWSSNPETYALLRRHHIDTVVQGGTAQDPFYAEIAPKYGFRTMAPCGVPVNVDSVRSLGEQPAVACWMIDDEPDWKVPPNIMLFVDDNVRMYNKTKPTFLTLCRNVRFFEYAAIADIPCMDHYSVTAPSSSKWPKYYGTRLEETAYYTSDLKAASEPKPIWIWSQAIANWGERPKRPVPTPNELAAQLMLNLGRGAKGIIWFNYDHEVGEKYPDTREAMRQWGRVLRVTCDDFLASEPYDARVEAPDKVDVAALATWDKVLLCITNLDYEIHPEAYPFQTKKDLAISLRLPAWMKPAAALAVDPDGVRRAALDGNGDRTEVTIDALEACRLIVLANDREVEKAYSDAYAQALADEKREF